SPKISATTLATALHHYRGLNSQISCGRYRFQTLYFLTSSSSVTPREWNIWRTQSTIRMTLHQ
ncbi:hypothetical protein, partial [Isoptericola sp. BMS4]|uniref:hypothetical protein n=1 Tax=Isoptericola sp. BMS4 TaxID=2527875 RepID=UPI00196BB14B